MYCDPRPKNVWDASLAFLSLLVLILQSSPLWANISEKQIVRILKAGCFLKTSDFV